MLKLTFPLPYDLRVRDVNHSSLVDLGECSGGPVVKNLPCNGEDADLTPVWGTKIPYTMGQLVHVLQSPHAMTRESMCGNEALKCCREALKIQCNQKEKNNGSWNVAWLLMSQARATLTG